MTLGFKSAIIKSPVTDIFFILLHHAFNINLIVYMDTGTGNHRKIINITELGKSLSKDYCSALLGFHVFSGEDCTSAFKGKGKVSPLKKLEKNPRFFKTFMLVKKLQNLHK